MHIRTQIRNKIKEVLKANSIRAFDPLFGSLSEDDLPCVVVDIAACNIDPASIDSLRKREFVVTLSIIHKASKGVDDVIDGIMAKNEKTLLADPFFDDNLTPFSEKLRDNNEGDQTVKVIDQSFLYTVYTSDCETLLG